MKRQMHLFLAVLAAIIVSSVSSKHPQSSCHHSKHKTSTVSFRGGGGGSSASPATVLSSKSLNCRNRRWNTLMDKCVGCWSGTIGWYDIDIKGSEGQYEYTLNPRSDNNKRNMRLSFQPRKDDPTTADWVVYHAKGQDVREEVTLRNRKDNNGDLPIQIFYSFEGGNLGRSGTNFMELPVIEHGFWDISPDGSGERRTVVLVYNPQSGHLMKVCYLQQKKKVGEAVNTFDVSGVEKKDIGIMPKKPRLSMKDVQRKWLHSPKSNDVEVLNVQKYRYKREDVRNDEAVLDALLSLFESRSERKEDDSMLHLSLPNGVILACPLSIKSNDDTRDMKSFNITLQWVSEQRRCDSSDRIWF